MLMTFLWKHKNSSENLSALFLFFMILVLTLQYFFTHQVFSLFMSKGYPEMKLPL